MSDGVPKKNTVERGKKAMLLVLFHSCIRLRTVVHAVEDTVVEAEESPPMCVYEADECPVCTEAGDALRVMSCGHCICAECHEKLLQHSYTWCPICRSHTSRHYNREEVMLSC